MVKLLPIPRNRTKLEAKTAIVRPSSRALMVRPFRSDVSISIRLPLMLLRSNSRNPWRTTRITIAAATIALVCMGTIPAPALGQSAADWLTGVLEQAVPDANSAAPREALTPQESATPVPVRLMARLTADGEPIREGLVWRVFGKTPESPTRTLMIASQDDANPTFQLRPGDYVVNAALGQAHITRRVTVHAGEAPAPAVEEFVLNAGGLRVKALVDGAEAAPHAASYSIYSDRDQTDARQLVMSSARPGIVVRLNAGIYHIVSTYGDCNAIVSTDVTVEAGKLTEVALTHSAAKATFKLVRRTGGEALPDTQWSIQTPQGEEVKASVGALPTHILAPGSYTVTAKSQGRAFQREITLSAGETAQVEVVMR